MSSISYDGLGSHAKGDHELEVLPLVNRSESMLRRAKEDLNSLTLTDSTTVTGWNGPLVLLLLNGVVSVGWGVALSIFASRLVPVTFALSELAKKGNPEYVNVVTTLVATLASMHLMYIIQNICDQYTSVLLVEGFTLGQLRWLQGVKEMTMFAQFADKHRFWSKKRFAWLIVYAGFAFHGSSIVAILQPETFYKFPRFGDQVPCGVEPGDLTLETEPHISAAVQQLIDTSSFKLGLAFANYDEQVSGNTTTSIAGRVYAKDSYAYGGVGGLENGLQEVPGALITAQCTNDLNTAPALWQEVFPDRSPPNITSQSDGSRIITDTPIPSQMRNVSSHSGAFTPSSGENALYGLIQPSGNGGLIALESRSDTSPEEKVTVCTWKTTPKLLHVQMVNYTAGVLPSTQDHNLFPVLIGRATLATLRGMAQASRFGASFHPNNLPDPNSALKGHVYYQAAGDRPTTARILEVILADGCKASLTAFNIHWSVQYGDVGISPNAPPGCSVNNRAVKEHWRFGNARNLGYVAIVWTAAVGLLAIGMVIRLKPRVRMQKDGWTLGVVESFILGMGQSVREDTLFYVRNGKVHVEQ